MARVRSDLPVVLNRGVRGVGALLLATGLMALAATDAAAAPRHKTPTPTITDRPAAQTNVRSATFAFTDALADAAFSCSLDNQAYSACTSPITFAGPLAARTH